MGSGVVLLSESSGHLNLRKVRIIVQFVTFFFFLEVFNISGVAVTVIQTPLSLIE